MPYLRPPKGTSLGGRSDICDTDRGTRTSGKGEQDSTKGHCGPGLLRTWTPSIAGWSGYYGIQEYRLRETTEVPGYAAKLVEDMKFYTDKTSERHVARIHGELHIMIIFAVEDGGRLGARAQAFLHTLAERAVRQDRRSRAQLRDPGGNVLRNDGATHVSMWAQRWQRYITSWLHLTLSRQLLRLFCPQRAAEDFYN